MAEPQKTGPDLGSLFEAVVLLYENRETDETIAQQLGVTHRTLGRWKKYPELQAFWQAVAAYDRRQGWMAEREGHARVEQGMRDFEAPMKRAQSLYSF